MNVEVKGMIIGLTGGIACGKSTVAAMLVARGAFLVDADAVAREVVEPGEPALEAIASAFGQAVKKADGTLDRKSWAPSFLRTGTSCGSWRPFSIRRSAPA
ncbi:hypothetical protein PACILC2_32340 [Paenibacillus cisolokensis]|uniref:Dephospho-CoA kinase n=1 Tax=Paenibacillus cisolokensis TaxID=1658519 RepID=A0ABQ4N9T1_9BACL|nr:hypothetical protein PACILC2_32340 [Paenibacillus cisolokensis]